MPLVESLQGHGTGWCSAGESIARTQLDDGDFHVYYSLDKSGEPTVPRVAIRMEEDEIAEHRGMAYEQNLDPFIDEVVEEKMKEFPDSEKYVKKTNDMKLLTQIENKSKAGEQLTKDELVFLYEIDTPIEGFGYERDPRITEVLNTRNRERDAPIALGLRVKEIAHNKDEVNEHTRAYIGPLYPGIFKELYNIEHHYIRFPEERVRYQKLRIGGKTKEQLMEEIRGQSNYISVSAMDALKSSGFGISQELEELDLVSLPYEAMKLDMSNLEFEKLYTAGKEFGLELCPVDVGIELVLQDKRLPSNDGYIVMEPNVVNGDRYVFIADSVNDGVVLGITRSADSLVFRFDQHEFTSTSQFIFRIPNPSQKS